LREGLEVQRVRVPDDEVRTSVLVPQDLEGSRAVPDHEVLTRGVPGNVVLLASTVPREAEQPIVQSSVLVRLSGEIRLDPRKALRRAADRNEHDHDRADREAGEYDVRDAREAP